MVNFGFRQILCRDRLIFCNFLCYTSLGTLDTVFCYSKQNIGSDFISKGQKQLLKWGFVILIVGIIVYTFRDQAGPILHQLKETSPWVVVLICLSSLGYECMEGAVTTGFARQYQKEFSYLTGVESAFFCSFYRVATLGSGSGVAAVYYFNEKGIPVSKGTGMYMVEYVLHKLSIAIFSVIFFAGSFRFMMEHFGEYAGLLAAGYIVTALIAAAMVFVCYSTKLHRWIFLLLDKINRKHKFDGQIGMIREQCAILEEASAFLLKKPGLIMLTVGKNLVKLAFWYGIPYVVFYGTGTITLAQTLAVTSLSVMLAAVLPSPAGIGSTEFMFTLLFASVAGTGAAGSASLLYRFATFVFPFLVGAFIVLKRRIGKRK